MTPLWDIVPIMAQKFLPKCSIRLNEKSVLIILRPTRAFHDQNLPRYEHLRLKKMEKSNSRKAAFKVDHIFRLDFKNFGSS